MFSASTGPIRIALVGATGLIGRAVVEACIGREDVRLVGIARREMKLPAGARMELFVADPAKWEEVLEAVKPQVMINALGTTLKKSGGDEDAFRAVDQELVLEVARAAHRQGVQRFISVSSVGAHILAKSFYLQVKGEVERDLAKVGFRRLDILRPSLLRGARPGDLRFAERIGMIASPLANLMLQGGYRKYRAVEADTVADAALALALTKPGGKFAHEHDAILRAANSLPQPEPGPMA
ncbi:NAD(P)H-binding protein [Allopontixanthobacter sp.]|uniref:NAD(P)H-binding protein n=1 Tax=Allopontixanthobacter sp. TaxID=2906452 RepID=UPI002AB8D15B|nr:NAD(P)H-binding protein [Allopontixanthobacter sp.]MDZ4308623.1 NAD(P)H-binding protein [Allopontixanthobacter sp.]